MARAQTAPLPLQELEPSRASQLDANDIPDSADEPGPGHYFGPESNGFSSLSVQRFSKNRSEPVISMAKTSWKEWGKVYITKGHVAGMKGKDAPGVGTYLSNKQLSTLGKAAPKMGTSLRQDLASTLGVDPYCSPGPAYNTDNAFKSLETEKSSKIGRSKRFQGDGMGVDVGPGQYDRKDVALKFNTGRSFGIGRVFYDKVLRPGSDREGQGKESFGPGPPLWRDISKDGSHAHMIPKTKRFQEDRERASTPGPGAYDREERSVSGLRSVCSDTRTPGGTKFGKPPRKPRLRQNLASVTANNSQGGMWGYF